MSNQQNQKSIDEEKLKEIPKWIRKYAQNRTAPVLIGLVIFLFIFAGIAIPSYFGGKAYRSGNMLLLWICILSQMIVIPALIFCSVPKWGGKFIERISRRLYSREGDVFVSVPESMQKKRWLGYAVAMVFASCVFLSVKLGSLGYLSIKYMQPISAVYGVPFLVFLYCMQRPNISSLALLWPILYGIHAILVVAGVPIQFGEPWMFLNMLIPIAGYGILCGLAGHIYSRYALKKLKMASRLDKKEFADGA